jgi:S-adenosylmethionine:tRNA ribosyltransferase-isomerase
MKAAYAHAIEQGYRFYSYGDACLLFRASGAGRSRGIVATS